MPGPGGGLLPVLKAAEHRVPLAAGLSERVGPTRKW